jgi:hypothetical protein
MSNTINIKTTENNRINIPVPNTIYVSNIIVDYKTYHQDGIKYVDTKITVYPGLPVDTSNLMHPVIQYIPLSYIGL